MNLNQMLEDTAKKFPDSIAVIFGNKKISYNQLVHSVKKLANALLDLGIKKNDKIAILSKNSLEFIISYFAIIKLGCIVVPLNYMLKQEEIKFILQDSGAVCLFTQAAFIQQARNVRLRLESLKNIILIDKEKTKDTINFYELLEDSKAEGINIDVFEDDTAAILYTSGTTGHPKGAMLTHYNIVSNVKACVWPILANKKDNFICLLPMFHSFAWTVCVTLPFYLGARTTVVESIQPFREVIKAVTRWRVTVFVAVPAIYSVLADVRLPRILRLPFVLKLINPIKLCISGAAALPVEVLRKFENKFKVPLLEGYGLTEASPVVTITPFKEKHKPGSIGRALSGVNLRITDEQDNDVSQGEVGELLVKGPNIMKGYYRLDSQTQNTLKDGWLHTGDLAKMDEDGYVYIVDRKKDMINVAGLKVYPREVEEVLYQHPKIAEAAVIASIDKLKGEVPKAYVALKNGQTISEQELIKFCRQRIASYKVPHKVEFKESLPKTTTGKILRRALK